MKKRLSKQIRNRESRVKPAYTIAHADDRKLSSLEGDAARGIDNYSLFHFFPCYNWPAWVTDCTGGAPGRDYRPCVPFLLNRSRRHWISLSTLLTPERLLVDTSLMFFTSWSLWSLELWLFSDGQVIRPHLAEKKPEIKLNGSDSVFSARWTFGSNTVSLEGFCARLSGDEAIITVRQKGRNKKGESLLIALRPYNAEGLGHVENIAFDRSRNIFSVDGTDVVSLSRTPELIVTGNGSDGDIDGSVTEGIDTVSCPYGLATMAAAYQCKNGDMSLTFRVLLSREGTLSSSGFDEAEAQREFSRYIAQRIEAGTKLKISDRKLQGWFSSSKLVLSNRIKKSSSNGLGITHFQEAVIIKALIAAGFLNEALGLIEKRLSHLSTLEKGSGQETIQDLCYTIITFSDYYTITRDSDLLQENFKKLNSNRDSLLSFTRSIVSTESLRYNDIALDLKQSGHLFDIILFCSCLENCSYLARSMGMFGDEKKYEEERRRLSSLFLDGVKGLEEKVERDSFFFYSFFGFYPLGVKEFSTDMAFSLLQKINYHYNSFPLMNPSLGMDLFGSALLGAGAVRMGFGSVHEWAGALMKPAEKFLYMPDFINPDTGEGCFGNGASVPVSAAAFLMLRNMIFVENEEHLDLFPVPKEAWFSAGKEILVENAPSRFGRINFQVKSTSNEINIFFDELPRFVPPEIRITLPFKFKVDEGEDFIIKKHIDNTLYINGWPSALKIFRK